MSDFQVHIYNIEHPTKGSQRIASFQDAESIQDGIIARGVLGILDSDWQEGDLLTPDKLVPNSEFIDYVQATIQKYAHQIPDLTAEAGRIGEGVLYMVDGRTADIDNVPAYDVLGRFAVVDGWLQPLSYQVNPDYLVLTDRGFLRLPEFLVQHLYDKSWH